MKCKKCKNKCIELKRPNPILKKRIIKYQYCDRCEVLYHFQPLGDGDIVFERKLREGDRVEGERFVPRRNLVNDQ